MVQAEEDRRMADINLTQPEADALLAMEKHRVSEDRHEFPTPGVSCAIPLQSPDKREAFLLDMSRARIALTKVKLQNRARQVVVLARIDFGGSPHRNPDDQEIACPHLHVYREGYGDKWAEPLPAERFPSPEDTWASFGHFLAFCNITRPPHIDRGLFI